jgi:ribonuclease VapC
MVILDSSAIVAVIRREQGHEPLIEAMEGATNLAIGAPTLAETAIFAVPRLGVVGPSILSRFIEENRVIVIPFDDRHWGVASEAFIRYGKDRHAAALGFGDCMTYATTHLADEPLLFVGEGFVQTDVVSALTREELLDRTRPTVGRSLGRRRRSAEPGEADGGGMSR